MCYGAGEMMRELTVDNSPIVHFSSTLNRLFIANRDTWKEKAFSLRKFGAGSYEVSSIYLWAYFHECDV